jgi:putative ABC transport system permease protein
MLIKTLVPGMVGGVCGIFASIAAHSALLAGFPFPRELDIRIDVPVWLFSIGLSIMSSILIAVAPAARASGSSVREAIHTMARSHTASRKQLFFQDVLTAVETGIALVLVVSAGLLINSFWRLTSVDPGFNPQRLPSVGITLPGSYSFSQKTVYFDEALTRLRVLSGIESIAATENLPIDSASYVSFVPPASEATAEARPLFSKYNGVTEAYFETLQIPVLAGRTFSEIETQRDTPVALVSESFARAMWPRRNPLGQRFTRRRVPGFTFPDLTVVGVVGDIRSRGLNRNGEPTVYIPLKLALKERSGNSGRKVSVVARTSASVTDMRQAIAAIDPNALIVTTSMESTMARSVARQRFRTTLLTSFAVVALMLAALGTYSVLSFSVSRRTREIGVRMAVGARPTQVFAEILRRALIPGIFGIGGGLAVSYAMRRVLTSYLFQIQPTDAPTYVAVSLTLALVLLIACALPARRATKLDPMAALRCE